MFLLSAFADPCHAADVRQLRFILLELLALGCLCGLSGCTITTGTVKERGAYTTLAMHGQRLDLPSSGYTSYKNFGPGQTPAAVIVGYGSSDGIYNHPQQFDLQVIEAKTGAVVLDTSGSEYEGRAAVVDLPIRKTGDYQLKLLIDNSVSDTWDFTVDRGRDAAAGAQGAPEPAYAKGNFSISMPPGDEAFTEYDAYFLDAVNNAVQRASNKAADRSIFFQVPAGKMVIQFQLDQAGNVNSPRITENTLGEALGRFYLQALRDGAPYKSWKAGTPTRQMKVTFYYE